MHIAPLPPHKAVHSIVIGNLFLFRRGYVHIDSSR
jgi:hypothetical protein